VARPISFAGLFALLLAGQAQRKMRRQDGVGLRVPDCGSTLLRMPLTSAAMADDSLMPQLKSRVAISNA
jgi:hypothetical protein